jgi:hypothetical protein
MCLRRVLAGLALAAALFTTGCASCPCNGHSSWFHRSPSSCCQPSCAPPTSCCSEGTTMTATQPLGSTVPGVTAIHTK